jgi:cytosine permease
MGNEQLPGYLNMARPNPAGKRAPWYKSTAPAYAGIFLWVVFYKTIADGTLSQAGLFVSLLGLVAAAIICHFLFYLVPGLLGMKTGYPLYVIGSSTYGTEGGFLMPGLLMGLLQFGWLAVNIAVSSDFISQAFGLPPVQDPITGAFEPSTVFIIVAIIWALLAVFVAVKGIQYLGRVSTFLPVVPLVMILIVFIANVGSAGKFTPAAGSKPLAGFLTMITIVVGFFATAGAAGVDFGMGNRNIRDVWLGGLVGVVLAIMLAGGLPLIAIAGAHGANPALKSFAFDVVIREQGGFLAKSMFILFAITSFAPACFSSFIGGNSIATLFPKINKTVMVSAGAGLAAILAITGKALNLVEVFSIIGASFGPICGAMFADYLLSGKKWAGPRRGWNLAGWLSWAVGFIIGIAPLVDLFSVPAAPLAAFIVGAVLYAMLAKIGLEPTTVEMPQDAQS